MRDWRRVINEFNPVSALDQDAVARTFVDRHAGSPADSIVVRLVAGLENSIGEKAPFRSLLAGHVGSGKTYELIRVGQELHRQGQFFVVLFDAEQSIEVSSANHFDVLVGMGVAIYKAALDAGLHPDPALPEELLKSIATFVRKFEKRRDFELRLDDVVKQVMGLLLTGGGAALGGPPGAVVGRGLASALTTRLELHVGDALVRTLELPANRQQVVGALNAIITDVESRSNRRLLVIVDGLDKAPGRARMFFADSALLAEPGCALLYSCPIEFYHRPSAGQARDMFGPFRILSNPPLHDRPASGDSWDAERVGTGAGMAVLERVLSKRLEAMRPAERDIITPGALTVLARSSGGVLREFVRQIRGAAEIAQLSAADIIDKVIAERAVAERRVEFSAMLTVEAREAIEAVLRQGALSGAGRERLRTD